MNPDNQYMKNNILIMNIQEKCQKFLSEGFFLKIRYLKIWILLTLFPGKVDRQKLFEIIFLEGILI